MKPIKLLVFIFLFAIMNTLNAQSDKTFWFAAPEAASNHGEIPIFLRMSSFGQSSDVTITQPANPLFQEINITIAASSTFSLDLSLLVGIVENNIPDTILNRGILIESTNEITAYYEVKGRDLNPDIFTLKGDNALGTEFYIPSQNFYANAPYDETTRNGFHIVATEDSTVVEITPKKDLFGHQADVTFTVLLNKGETYSAIAANLDAASHLNGSYVTSNKPIAITVKDDSVINGGCRDMLGDQIVPTTLVGEEYIVIRGVLNDPDRIFITAVFDNTAIEVNNVLQATINQGETFQYDIFDPAYYVVTSEPAYLWHVSGFGCEMGAALLPSIDCTGSFISAFLRASELSNTIFGINILVEKEGTGNFILNGDSDIIVDSLFSPVPGTNDEWAFAQVPLLDAIIGQPNIIENTSNTFHLGVIDGGPSSGTRYGYFSNYAKFVNIDLATNSPICLGNELFLSAETIVNADYNWTGPDGFISNQQNPTISNVDANSSGTYTLEVNLGDCISDPIDIEVDLFDNPAVIASGNPTVLDVLQDIQLEATEDGNYTYSWEPADNLNDASAQDPIASNILQTTIFTVVVTDSNGCSALDSIRVEVTEEICKEPYVFIPNAISPNNDGLNDVFRVSGLLLESYYIVIYDRWGNQVFESTDQNESWDGRVDGKLMSGDAFAYKLLVECLGGYQFSKEGSITIVR